jgi:hypothetical protein
MKFSLMIILSFLIASAVGVLGVFMLQSLDQNASDNTDLKNLPYGIAIGLNLFLALGTLPIFLNQKPRIRDNFTRSALSFFLLPLVIMAYVGVSLEEEALTGLGLCVPYFIVLSVFFVRFRNQTVV